MSGSELESCLASYDGYTDFSGFRLILSPSELARCCTEHSTLSSQSSRPTESSRVISLTDRKFPASGML